MDNKPDKDITRIGKGKPGPGRPPKAVELGLSAMMHKAWPEAKRITAIEALAVLAETGRSEKVRVEATELLLKYAYGTPKAIDVTVDFDLHADIDAMTADEREIYKLKLQQYLAKRGITS